ncbi:beta-ketoacyl-[acyl-carrier-protein] synthase family protein [Catenovulum sp. 2E275]|uniref:beta-ketoacyl-[acyl-carrier-protein] synthase family protein n=1 Tax=Catenovulum sp. 2E275 TaxID=2980497 RepID=UPI0021CF3F71|nr:beta-ketoacyl-[acyl-carrier-protein] synthase family protein [Catenovulum sp. 2E275]MCU4676649.1 beta-ketoacyl-[acyl-carrier-protein] synthase family protein [Catenovulum sp. 2E275]
MMSAPLYIHQIALINALGCSNQQISDNLFAGSQAGLIQSDTLLANGQIMVAQVQADLPDLSAQPVHFQSRNNQLAMAAYVQIAEQINQLKQQYGSERIGVIVGTSTSGIAQGEAAMLQLLEQGQFPEHYHYRQQEVSNIAGFIAEVAGLTGFCLSISTACSSSAKSFVTARELIEAGVIDAAIVGGVDSLCGMTVNGFSALESTAAHICLPGSKNRDGINIGEAAALAIVAKQKSNNQAQPHIALLGAGESSDAYHMSAPEPDGKGAEAAMIQALQQAGLSPAQIDYINLHGTATVKNDQMETLAINRVFANKPYVSSSKAMIGHTLGAAGATEVGLCYLVLQQQKLAPHIWDNQPDPDLPALNWVKAGETNPQAIQYCLTNSFAFGGNNVALILGLCNE